MSLQVLCVKSIMDNNLDYTILPECLKQIVDYEMHKIKFKDTLYILDTVYAEISNINDILILKVQPVLKDDFVYDIEDDEKYNFIFITFLYRHNNEEFKDKKFIQELNYIEFD